MLLHVTMKLTWSHLALNPGLSGEKSVCSSLHCGMAIHNYVTMFIGWDMFMNSWWRELPVLIFVSEDTIGYNQYTDSKPK
jgi:hypothetical protein